LKGVVSLITGNPYPLSKIGGILTGSKYITKLIADPKFLRIVREAIVASKTSDASFINSVNKKMMDYLSETYPAILQEIKNES